VLREPGGPTMDEKSKISGCANLDRVETQIGIEG